MEARGRIAAIGAVASVLLGPRISTAADHHYGGVDAMHDCGTIQHVRIEYGGSEVAPSGPVPGLTVGACGSGTIVDFVQVHRAGGDGIEVLGGTTKLAHVMTTQAGEDGLDWHEGWVGRVQFLIIQQAGANGIEGSNASVPDAVPVSSPRIFNATLVGLGASDLLRGQVGAVFQAGSAGELRNALLLEHSAFSVDVVGNESRCDSGAARGSSRTARSSTTVRHRGMTTGPSDSMPTASTSKPYSLHSQRSTTGSTPS